MIKFICDVWDLTFQIRRLKARTEATTLRMAIKRALDELGPLCVADVDGNCIMHSAGDPRCLRTKEQA